MGLLFPAAALALFVTLVLLPGAIWLDRRQQAVSTGAPQPTAEWLGLRSAGLRTLADLIKRLGESDVLRPGTVALGARVAPVVAFVLALTAFAVIPFAGVYSLGRSGSSGVLADPEWGLLLFLPVAAGMALARSVVGLSGVSTASQLGGLRVAGQGTASMIALGASLLPMWVVYGTFQPSVVAAAQDRTIGLAALLARVEPTLSLGFDLTLPAWGVVLNPLAFLLAGVAAMAVTGAPPFDAARADVDLEGGFEREVAGLRAVLLRGAEYLQTVGLAALFVVVFFGGWSIPWLSQSTLVGAIEPHLGRGFGELVCLAVHLASFGIKLAGLLWLTFVLRWGLPRLRHDQILGLCVRTLIPVALVDLGLTVLATNLLGGSTP